MCARYKQTSPIGFLASMFGITILPDFAASGVISPGMKAPVIRGGALTLMTWGFVPNWAKEDMKTKIINARLETLLERPSFRKAKRCLIPANGFFEWDKSQKPSRPVDFHLEGDAPFAFAGVCDEWTDKATGEVRETFAIVTTAAVDPVAAIHDRMPVILTTPETMAAWNNMEILTPESVPLLTRTASFPRESDTKETAQLTLF